MIDLIGGPDRDRTDDLFHAMEARSQLRHRPTYSGLQLPYCLRLGPIRQTQASSGMGALSQVAELGNLAPPHLSAYKPQSTGSVQCQDRQGATA
jgi:hypothetical protein